MAEPYAESPLATYTEVLSRHSVPGRIDIAERPFVAQVDVRVDPKSPAAERIGTALGAMLPNQPGEVAVAGELSVLWLGPDEWLILGPEGSQETIQDTVNAALDGDHAAVVDVSANRTILSITGPKTRELLNKGCALDLHPRSFAVDRCAQTMLARAGVILVCRDTQLPSYWVIVRSSFARYVADWLADAAVEYGSGSG
ncbi:sarcosine oxidase subunit gamma [Halopolyspora algeriensis]|uniref:Sarcosine oxidase subunit gamma n=1 Tax=Halopolyspora algeriensis TaxID=1500506 RepID=A0A368VVW2_9ACTN|nr:sarcosine oxidase subunit gamma family protein [Halopolyspora algeriensis]RCW46244.1 sarcosine oxidase subunit gamma [Halopolyspora algeriensis]TQM55647.1 sarcosine oxidase subunit gamma [Halopolyspora algeriensis]